MMTSRMRLVLLMVLSPLLLQLNGAMSISPEAPPVLFVLDFDGTITTKDTIATVSSCGLEVQKSRGRDLTEALQDLVAKYSEDYAKHAAAYKPTKEERSTLDDEIAFLRSTREVELQSFGRVSASQLFQGIADEEWRECGKAAVAAGEVKIRPGFKDFIAAIHRLGGTWGVVSVNFSKQFIRGVVLAAGVDAENVEIYANWPDDAGALRGPDGGPPIATSDAKLDTTMNLLEAWESDPKSRSRMSRFVYIGDSGTDIECLAAEGAIGIAMTDNGEGSLMGTLRRVGVDVVHINTYEDEMSGSRPVYFARNFEEIIESPLLQEAVKC